jgi:hypothetical protein
MLPLLFHVRSTYWPFALEIGATFLLITNYFYRHSYSRARLLDAASCGFGATACVAIISLMVLVNFLGS